MGFRFELVSLDLEEIQALDPAEIVESKARGAWARIGRPVLVDDSGLAIHAWGGFPGALVKWLVKTGGVESIARMLDPFPDRGATATCAVGFYDGSTLSLGRGECPGSIAAGPRGEGGFGWDSLFIPEGFDRTFAELPDADKDRISHRRRAWDDLARRLPGFESR